MMLKRIFRYGCLFVAIAAVTTALLASCKAGGERGKQLSLGAGDTAMVATAPRAVTLDEALEDLEALARPPGVAPALWQRLKDRLRESLISRQPSKGVCIAPLAHQDDDDRGDNRNIIEDLCYWQPKNLRAKGMEFHYRNLGDYDQNGIVAIADITPIAA